MAKKLRGVVHGKSIEVAQDLGLTDGQVVELTIRPIPPAQPTPGAATKTAAGALANEWSEEDDRILEDLHRERKGARWKTVPE